MLTIISLFSPRIKDIQYSILAEYCLQRAKYYCRLEDGKNGLYWSQMASKHLMKRFELMTKKRA